MKTKTVSNKFTADNGDGVTRFTAIITTAAIDRDGEVVMPSGMNSKHFESNPVLLYAHDATKPIGKMVNMRRSDTVIEADFSLVPRPSTHEGEWFPDTVGALMKFGALNGTSIGFSPMKNGFRNATKGDTEKYGVGVSRVYSKWNLMEVSVVAVPSNQEALVAAVSKGILSSNSAKAFGMNIEKTPSNIHSIRVVIPRTSRDDLVNAARFEVARMKGQFRL